MTKQRVKLAQEAVEKCGAILHGLGPDVQGAVLADLLAMWLAGHQAIDVDINIDAYRKALLSLHIETVLKLVVENEKALLARVRQ